MFISESAMPEGPEHFKSSQFINKSCKGRLFSGKVIKSEVSIKNPDVEFQAIKYEIRAKSRGKELMITLTEHINNVPKLQEPTVKLEEDELGGNVEADRKEFVEENDKGCAEDVTTVSIVFQFGMSGCFRFTTVKELHKHSHLMFHTGEPDGMVLSYVDSRRFGRWRISDKFSSDRGPDSVSEYQQFRKNILGNLEKKLFQKPICEVLHRQEYFNGIGNYLRAEILFRANIRPFEKAIDILSGLDDNRTEPERKNKGNEKAADILEWCTLVPFEVMMLEGGGYDPSEGNTDFNLFEKWLRCYSQEGMKNLVDKDGRTIWFQGEPGPLAPKGDKVKSRRRGTQKTKKQQTSKTKAKKDNKTEIKTNDIKQEEGGKKGNKRKMLPANHSTPKRKSKPNALKERVLAASETRRSARLRK